MVVLSEAMGFVAHVLEQPQGRRVPAELDRLMKYWTNSRKSTETLEASLRETLSVVLSSPRFLGLPASRTGGGTKRLTDHELAARVSYFLWSTMPDEIGRAHV